MAAGRLKVLMVTAWYPSAANPAAGSFVQTQARAVAGYHDVVVLHAAGLNPRLDRPWQVSRETNPAWTGGLPTYRVAHRLSPVPKTSYLLHLWSVWAAYREVVRQGFRPDIIHAHTYQAALPALLLARAQRRPLLVTEHFSAFVTGTLPPGELRKARLALGRAACVVAVSRYLQAAMERSGVRARFQVIPNAVDTSLFRSGVPAAGWRPARARLLFAAALNPAKGLPDLLQALAGLEAERAAWQLDVAGDGPGRGEYERLASDLGLAGRVTFHGYCPPAQLAALMRASDALVVASHVETFSVVAAEALACGLPVLSTRCGGPEEFITSEVGRLVAAGDVTALREGLASLLEHLGDYAPERIARYAGERFSLGAVGGQLDALYRSLVAAGSRQQRMSRT